MNDTLGKILRVVAIVFMGLTAAMNILGGAGTSCAAFFTKSYPPYWGLIQQDVQWLWQVFVVVTILVGLAGVWATVQLIRRKENAYRNAVIVLICGTVINIVHVWASLKYLEAAVPANMVMYTNIITLVIFLILRIPGVWERVDFSGSPDPSDKDLTSGMTAIVAGIVTLSTGIWVGPSHIYRGENWVDVLMLPLVLIGSSLILGGVYFLVLSIRELTAREVSIV